MFNFKGVIGTLVLLAVIIWVGYDWIHKWRNERRQKKTG